jgi:SPASM domain peptide maturase of grasp-with-spasm system
MKMKNKEILSLFANCMIVDGHCRSIICDLQRNSYHLIPLSLSNLFVDKRYIHVPTTFENVSREHHDILKDYFEFLLEKELVFELSNISDLDNFPPLNLDWNYPSSISNAIIDVSKDYNHDYSLEFAQLEDLGCRHLQIRFYRTPSIDELELISDLIYGNNFISIQCLFPYDIAILNTIRDIIDNNIKFSSIILYGAPFDKIIYDSGGYGVGTILSTMDNIFDESNCGCIHHKYFSVNIENFTESMSYNTCLNRKIAIDKNGYIKNCPSMQKSYGHVDNTTISDVLKNLKFKALWEINKNRIEKCKDCEFRYICTDCRAYTENPNDIYSAPLKCGYNPYKGEWDDWTSNPLKEQAIQYYNLR